MEGWLKLYRALADKAFYKDSEKVHVFVHLLIKANYGKREEMFGGKPIKLQPGQLTTGRKQLANELNMDENKIQRILEYFEKVEQLIEQQTSNKNRLITIANWSKYQSNGTEVEQQNEQQVNNNRTTSEQQPHTLKERKNIRKKEESKASELATKPKLIKPSVPIKKPVRKPRVKKQQDNEPSVPVKLTPYHILTKWISEDWLEAYPKTTRRNILWTAIDSVIPKDISKDDALTLNKLMKEHSEKYIANGLLPENYNGKYLVSPQNYIENRMWTKPILGVGGSSGSLAMKAYESTTRSSVFGLVDENTKVYIPKNKQTNDKV
jgi:hypothetical protein